MLSNKTMGVAAAIVAASLVLAAPFAASAVEPEGSTDTSQEVVVETPSDSTTTPPQTEAAIEPSVDSSQPDETVDTPAASGEVTASVEDIDSGTPAGTPDQATVDSSASSDAGKATEYTAPSAEPLATPVGCTITPQRPFRDVWENVAAPIGTYQYKWQTWDGVTVAGPQAIPRGGLGLRAIPGVCNDGSPAEFTAGVPTEWWFDYLLTPPDITRSGNTVPLPADDGVVYKDASGGVISGTVSVPPGGLTFTREPASGYFFPEGTQLSFSFEYLTSPVSPVGVTFDTPAQSVTIPEDPNFTYAVEGGDELQPGVHVLGPVGEGSVVATPKPGVTVDPYATTQWPFNFPAPEPPKLVTPPALAPIGDRLPIPVRDGVVYTGPNGVVTGTVTLPDGQEQCFDAAPVGDVVFPEGVTTRWCFTYHKPTDNSGGNNGGGSGDGGQGSTDSGSSATGQHQTSGESSDKLAVTGATIPVGLPIGGAIALVAGFVLTLAARRRKQVV